VDRFALAAALRRVGLVSEENSQATLFTFSPEGLDLKASSAQVGRADERVPVTYEGAPVTICVSWKHVLNALDVSSAPMMTMTLKDARSPMLLLDGKQHLAVILPITAS
jgi:DNA polymerase III sliding clamp (beta) subunit (PCNA family)